MSPRFVLASTVAAAAIVALAGLALAAPPAGYRCGKGGKPSPKTEGCTCPKGKKSTRSADDLAVCAVKSTKPATIPAPVFAPPPPLPTCPSDMVPLPAGSFDMGSAVGAGGADEIPSPKGKRTVKLTAFCVDRTEVTVEAYADCVSSGACSAAADTVDWPGLDEANRKVWNDARVCNGNREDRQAHPVNCVTWDQAASYCTSLKKRLPTEAEWEYAARGTDGRVYAWEPKLGAPSTKLFNGCDRECQALGKRLGFKWRTMLVDSDGFEATAPVGSFPDGASPFGGLDLAGNVWEWVADEYARYEGGVFTDPEPAATALAPAARSYVLRGGGWDSDLRTSIRTANRLKGVRSLRSSSNGFRCARAGS